jgi:hypothetical protein
MEAMMLVIQMLLLESGAQAPIPQSTDVQNPWLVANTGQMSVEFREGCCGTAMSAIAAER